LVAVQGRHCSHFLRCGFFWRGRWAGCPMGWTLPP